MRRFLHTGHFIVFPGWHRLVNAKAVLYVLAIGFVMLVIVQSGLHAIPGMHMPIFLADCDPWNG
jgi:hypothetical protein